MTQKRKKKSVKKTQITLLTKTQLTIEKRHEETMAQIKKALKLFPKIVEEQKQRHREGKPFKQFGISYEELLKIQSDREKRRKASQR